MNAIATVTLEGTKKGVLVKGTIIDTKDYFPKKTADELLKSGSLKEIEMEVSERSIEELLDSDIDTLTLDELKKICSHYKIPAKGNKGQIKSAIVGFETLLETEDLTTLSDEELGYLANYAEVELGEDRELNIKMIDEVLG